MYRFLPLALLLGCPPISDEKPDETEDVTAGPCPAYSGLTEVGRTWSWRHSDEVVEDSGPGFWSQTLTALDADGVYTLETEGAYEVEGFDSYTMVGTTTGKCDAEGAWLLEESGTVTFVRDGEETVYDSVGVYDPPYLSMPAGVEDGGSWTFDFTVTQTDGAGASSSFSDTQTLQAVGLIDVSVPAGDFTTMEFQLVSHEGGGDFLFWSDADVGMVEHVAAVLVSVE